MRASCRTYYPAIVLAAAVVIAAGGLFLADDLQYIGHAKCKMCHQAEHKIWMESSHAKAFEALKPEDQAKAECIGCHKTGEGKPAAAGADMNGVQCEACHGPGSGYKSMKIMSKKAYQENREAAHKAAIEAGLQIPTEETCLGCHNEKSPTFKGFDFASAKEKIKHWE